MYPLLRPLLFAMDPEKSHDLVMATLQRISAQPTLCRMANKVYGSRVVKNPTTVMGLDFPNPVGLAAGLDKQGNCANGLSALGFGWVELGTVTPLPQPGNEKPRMFRLTEFDAIINRMGFNSIGLADFLTHVKTTNANVIKGINIGKNALTPVEKSADDYLQCLDAVYDYADYIAINISSPNTSNLRSLQNDTALDQLLYAIQKQRLTLAERKGKYVPLVLKIAPDLELPQITVIANLLRKHQIDGVAATNTTISREVVIGHQYEREAGGLSGRPVRVPSTKVVAELFKHLKGDIPIIGVGGVDSPHSALEKFSAGADLIQLYTGFIYQGPQLIRNINQELRKQTHGLSFNQWLADLPRGCSQSL